MNTLRVYDIVLTNVAQELSHTELLEQTIKDTDEASHSLYRASNLGGGFSRTGTGGLVLNTGEITFTMIFETDVLSKKTGYDKYLETVEAASNHDMVWLRYAVPHGDGTFTYAYRPGFISEITKHEASYRNKSMVEEVTITFYDGWMALYGFDMNGAQIDLTPKNAKFNPGQALFSNYPDNFKALPFGFPFWYKKAPDECIQRCREDGTKPNMGTWWGKRGGIFNPKTDLYESFAVVAPSMSVSDEEAVALSYFVPGTRMTETEALMSRTAGKSSNASDYIKRDPKLAHSIIDSVKRFKNKRNQLFRSSLTDLANFSRLTDDMANDGPFKGNYGSFLIIGTTSENGVLSFQSSTTGVISNQLTFKQSGSFVIDTAHWADVYSLNGSSNGIDFSMFTKTSAHQHDRLVMKNGARAEHIIMRRPILGI